MRLKLLSLFMAIAMTVSCGGSSGGNNEQGSQTVDVQVRTIVDTGLEISSGTGSFTSRDIADNTVTILQPNGNIVTLTPTGNLNEYSGIINYKTGEAIYIKANMNGLRLKKFLPNINISDTEADLGITNIQTTMYSQAKENLAAKKDNVTSDTEIYYLNSNEFKDTPLDEYQQLQEVDPVHLMVQLQLQVFLTDLDNLNSNQNDDIQLLQEEMNKLIKMLEEAFNEYNNLYPEI